MREGLGGGEGGGTVRQQRHVTLALVGVMVRTRLGVRFYRSHDGVHEDGDPHAII